MRYFINVFNPETANIFAKSERNVSGFTKSREKFILNKKIGPGDKFISFVTKVKRFIGVLEVISEPYHDETPIFVKEKDPYILRFRVNALVWLPIEKAIPIKEDIIWNNLSITRNIPHNSKKWAYLLGIRCSPNLLPQKDGELLEKLLIEQQNLQKEYPLRKEDLMEKRIFGSPSRSTYIRVPENEETTELKNIKERNSIKIQAKIAEIGEKLGFTIWIPHADRNRVLNYWKPTNNKTLLQSLPLVLDDLTLKTVLYIDVLWIRNRAIIRAFEVEDTTSIYSGILRMADLLALQPMLKIKAHIVAPSERRKDVFSQLKRPVFSLIGERALSEICSYLSYEAINNLHSEEKLKHMNDSILDDCAEFVENRQNFI